MKKQRIYLPKLHRDRCFGCGAENSIGLKPAFYRVENTICTDIILSRYYEGWNQMAHGGIVSTLLEETMSWAVLFFRRTFFICQGMNLKYIKPIVIGKNITVSAKIDERSVFPDIKVIGEIRDPLKALLVKGKGQFHAIPLKEAAENREELRFLLDHVAQENLDSA